MKNQTRGPLQAVAVAAVVAFAVASAGCANMSDTQRTTAQGAGIGAAAGALLGAVTGGSSGAAKGAVIGAGAGAVGGYVWSQRMERQKRDMEAATKGTGIDVIQTPDNQLKLNIPSDVSFDTNRSDIKPNFAAVLDNFAQGLRQNTDARVRVVGHTDSSGNDAINNPLSVNRALSTRDYLVSRGIPTNTFTVEGWGSRSPVASNDTAEGRARNRRVEIFMGELPQPTTR